VSLESQQVINRKRATAILNRDYDFVDVVLNNDPIDIFPQADNFWIHDRHSN